DAGYCKEHATSIIADLLRLGYIEPTHEMDHRDKSGLAWYKIPELGRSFLSASAAKRIHRKTAEKAVCGCMEVVIEVNENPRFLVKVTEVVVYGSYVRGEERLGDLDSLTPQ